MNYLKSTYTSHKVEEVFIDSEKVNKTEDQLIELAACNNEEKIIFQTYIRPTNCNLSEFKQKQGYTKEKLMNAPLLEEILPTFYEIVKHKRCIIWNSEYELGIFPALADNCHSIACAMKRFSQQYGKWNPYFGDRSYVKLVDAAEKVGHTSHKLISHTATADVIATCKVWNWMEEQNLPKKYCSADLVPYSDYERLILENQTLKRQYEELESREHLKVVKPTLDKVEVEEKEIGNLPF